MCILLHHLRVFYVYPNMYQHTCPYSPVIGPDAIYLGLMWPLRAPNNSLLLTLPHGVARLP
jgi:hypothetical protein